MVITFSVVVTFSGDTPCPSPSVGPVIFHSETFGFELEAMVCAVRDGTLIDQ